MTTEYRNNASSTLTAGLTNSALDVTVSITSDTDFPGVTTPDIFYATLEDTAGQIEILKVTASKVVSNQFTVERGAGTTTPLTWAIGSLIEMRLVQANLEELRDHTHPTLYADLAATVDGAYHYATLSSSGTDAYTADISTSPGTYTAGLRVQFEADFANAAACSLNLNSLGVKSIKTQAGADPVDGYVAVGSLVDVEYDGTNFVLMSPSVVTDKDVTETLTNKTLSGGAIQSQTVKASTSGTNIDFTAIPDWAKRITILFDSVSVASTTSLELYLGTSAGIDSTASYEWAYTQNIVAASPTVSGLTSFSRFRIAAMGDGTSAISGRVVLEKLTGNLWVLSSTFKSQSPLLNVQIGSGLKTLTSDLTQVRVSASGAAFDAGQINVLHEG